MILLTDFLVGVSYGRFQTSDAGSSITLSNQPDDPVGEGNHP